MIKVKCIVSIFLFIFCDSINNSKPIDMDDITIPFVSIRDSIYNTCSNPNERLANIDGFCFGSGVKIIDSTVFIDSLTSRDTVNYLVSFGWYNYGAIDGGGGCLKAQNNLPYKQILFGKHYSLENKEFEIVRIDNDTLYYTFDNVKDIVMLGDSTIIRDSSRTCRMATNQKDTLYYEDHISTITIKYKINYNNIEIWKQTRQ